MKRYFTRISLLVLILLLFTSVAQATLGEDETELSPLEPTETVTQPTETPTPSENPTPTDEPTVTPEVPTPTEDPAGTPEGLTPTPTEEPEDDTLTLSPDGGYLTMGGEPILAKLRFETSRSAVEPDDDYSILGFDNLWFQEGSSITFTIVVAKGYEVTNVTTTAGTVQYLEDYGIYELQTSFEPTLVTVETAPISDLSPTPTEAPDLEGPFELGGNNTSDLTISIPYTPSRYEDLVLGKEVVRGGDEYIIALSSIDKDALFEMHHYSLTYLHDTDVLLHEPATLTTRVPDGWDATQTRLYSINSSLGTMSLVDTTVSEDGTSLCFKTSTLGYYAMVYMPGEEVTPSPTSTPAPTNTPIPTLTVAPEPEAPAPKAPSGDSTTSLIIALIFVIAAFAGGGIAFYFYVYKPNARR